jgi:hypothetical protein
MVWWEMVVEITSARKAGFRSLLKSATTWEKQRNFRFRISNCGLFLGCFSSGKDEKRREILEALRREERSSGRHDTVSGERWMVRWKIVREITSARGAGFRSLLKSATTWVEIT